MSYQEPRPQGPLRGSLGCPVPRGEPGWVSRVFPRAEPQTVQPLPGKEPGGSPQSHFPAHQSSRQSIQSRLGSLLVLLEKQSPLLQT